jgi:hypothetical protein
MKLEQQVCSLQLANKLKELGVKQESLCFWVKRHESKEKEWHVSVCEVDRAQERLKRAMAPSPGPFS